MQYSLVSHCLSSPQAIAEEEVVLSGVPEDKSCTTAWFQRVVHSLNSSVFSVCRLHDGLYDHNCIVSALFFIVKVSSLLPCRDLLSS